MKFEFNRTEYAANSIRKGRVLLREWDVYDCFPSEPDELDSDEEYPPVIHVQRDAKIVVRELYNYEVERLKAEGEEYEHHQATVNLLKDENIDNPRRWEY